MCYVDVAFVGRSSVTSKKLRLLKLFFDLFKQTFVL
jgi:hypothetical protein